MAQNIVFLGDSLTEWGKWNDLFPGENIINCGVAGDTTFDILQRLDAVIQQNPGKIFLMAGINDLGDGDDPVHVIANYREIVRRLSEVCPNLYLLSVLPVNTDRFFNPKLDGRQIILLNSEIIKLAPEKGCSFIDMHNYFADENNCLDDELSPDGLHLNKDGYILWKSLIEPFL